MFVSGATLRPGDTILTRDFEPGVTIMAYQRMRDGESFYDIVNTIGFYLMVPYGNDQQYLVERKY